MYYNPSPRKVEKGRSLETGDHLATLIGELEPMKMGA